MKLTYSYRLYPDEAQREALARAFGCGCVSRHENPGTLRPGGVRCSKIRSSEGKSVNAPVSIGEVGAHAVVSVGKVSEVPA